jgi:hypothetical protein
MDAKKRQEELSDDQLDAVAGGVGVPVSPVMARAKGALALQNRPPDPLEVGGALKMPPDDFG